jgi:hypothetical protein
MHAALFKANPDIIAFPIDINDRSPLNFAHESTV